MDYQERLTMWLTSNKVPESLKKEIEQADEETQKEMFSSDLHFGTAGMRALLGPGSSRLNALTVRKATIGVGRYLLQRFPHDAKKRGVAISFDNRHHSKEFRDIAAEILNSIGINVFTFRDPHPTPELSYTVRYQGCVAGLMITASHNPKEYNGYKFYDEKGCQGVYAPIQNLISVIEGLPDEIHVEIEDLKVPESERGHITYLDDDEMFDIQFIQQELNTSLYQDFFQGERLTKIIFTPECGCNCKVGPMALRSAGYEVRTVPNQDYFDPDFAGTKNPNPETDEAYEGAIQELKKANREGGRYNLILATDPDADRLGLAFIDSHHNVRRLSGNQTGALLIDFLLGTMKRRNQLPMNGVICNTFVTGEQGKEAAEAYGIKTITTATGFKYIGDMADRLEKEGYRYLFGYEESYGYLIAPFVRDKDSLQSLIAIADMTEYYLRQGKTLDIALKELNEKTGHFFDTQVSVFFQGADSLKRMNQEVEKIRQKPYTSLSDIKIKSLCDYEKRIVYDFQENTQKYLNAPEIEASNCLRFNFANGGFLAIRPSGTEPKVKFYFEIVGYDDIKAQQIVDNMVQEIKTSMGLEEKES